MVAYLRLLSTVLSRGIKSKDYIYLSGQTLQIKPLPDMSTDWDYTVNEYLSARYGLLPERDYRSTWESDSDIFGLKLRNVRTNIRANKEATLIDNGHSLFFHASKKLDVSMHLGSVNVLDTLPYRLAAVGLVWRVLAYETKIPLGNLTVLIGKAWILDSASLEAKAVLIKPVQKAQTITIKKRAGRNYAAEHFKLSLVIEKIPTRTL